MSDAVSQMAKDMREYDARHNSISNKPIARYTEPAVNKEANAKLQLLDAFIDSFTRALDARTSWGRNDLKELMKDIELDLLRSLFIKE